MAKPADGICVSGGLVTPGGVTTDVKVCDRRKSRHRCVEEKPTRWGEVGVA